MNVLELQKGTIYGPIASRRLGRSLGINLLPTDRKLCSFDCVYCQYGPTIGSTLSPAREPFPTVEDVLTAVEAALRAHPDINYVTFSGNGEPTLHPDFPAIASAVRRLRDRIRPGAELATFSNSTTVHLPRIQEALTIFDAPIMKLDAGDPETLAIINRPAPGVKLEGIIAGLRNVPNLIIQSVLVDGRVTNTQGEAFEAWVEALADVGPARIQIYSTDRPVAEAGVETVPPATLRHIAEEVTARTGLQVDAYWART